MKPRNYSSILKRILPFLALLLAILLSFHKMAFTNLILARGDTFLYFYPYWHAAAGALRAVRIPLWNPAIFMGAPLLANSQMGFFYPLNWPVWLLFDTPYAVNASILLHIAIAACGTYLVARKVARLGRSASFVAALVFALGGYLPAQVEHINQLQGLSWLPWLLLAAGSPRSKKRRDWLQSWLLIALFFALQLLAGHTQTAFISGLGLLLWLAAQHIGPALAEWRAGARWRIPVSGIAGALLLVAAAGLVALALAAVQVLPTLELSRLSSRQGGLPLNEVLSFSLNPLLAARALLPSYGQTLFSEYTASLPLSVLALALVGGWQWRRRPAVFPALVWVVAALLLALGAFNPLYWLLGRLPGFDLFRVPARWLALYAFGVALLAAVGWQTLLDTFSERRAGGCSESLGPDRRAILHPLLFGLLLFAILAIWAYAAGLLVTFIPTGAEAPFEAPSGRTLLGWVIEVGLLAAFFWLLFRRDQGRRSDSVLMLLLALIGAILFISTRLLPYNNLTTPQAYYDLRPSTARLLAEVGDPPQRLLSLSDIFFDLGEQSEIEAIYAGQLPPPAIYDYIVAAKQKEVLSPNLPMLYDLASIDGFDGGVLPLKAYTEQVRLILAEGVVTTDGRLREHLDAVPEQRWLDLFNMGYLITDKVSDLWLDGVFFDRQHPATLQEGRPLDVGFVPEYEATEVRLLATQQPGALEVTTTGGAQWAIEPQFLQQGLYSAAFPEAAVPKVIRVKSCPAVESCDLLALTLVDARDGTFQPLVPGQYRLIHSGDVKIYENLNVMPRAYAVTQWQWVEDDAAAQLALHSPDFDPHREAALIAEGSALPEAPAAANGLAPPSVRIDRYLPEDVVITMQTEQDALLVLSDAYYPGWQATIDGAAAPVFRANGLFRAVFVPAGDHQIRFTFQSRSFFYGALISLATVAIVTIIMAGYLLFKKK